MAAVAVATGTFAAYGEVLDANTVDTVTFADNYANVRVIFDAGTFPLYVTVDGTAPTVAGAASHRVPAVVGAYLDFDVDAVVGSPVVKIISGGTSTYSIIGSL